MTDRTDGQRRIMIDRRVFVAAGAAATLASRVGRAAAQPSSTQSASAQAAAPEWRHALALLGTPRYPAGFARFDYVRADAPKGGQLRLGEQGTFDNFNLFVAGVKGELEAGLGLYVYDTLMVPSQDEVGATYGLIAEAAWYPEDRSRVTYRLNKAARFADGSPITVADVIFSLETFKANSPFYAFYYHHVVRAEETTPGEVTFVFSEAGNRELPQIVGELPILPKAWWTGTGPGGQTRNPAETTLEPPLGSGAYRLAAFEAGRYALYERLTDYWAANHPTQVGRNNFASVRLDYYRDATVLLEGFKADTYDYRSENSARNWATAYDIPSVREGRVVKEEFPSRGAGIMQGFAFNTRRTRFADARVRRAFNLCFDFEDINRTIMYGLYSRIDSWFYGTELASKGLPEGAELALLENLRDKVPPRVFTTAYTNPVGGTAEATRANLREALRLLTEAGYGLKDRQIVSKSGEPFRVEFLGYDAGLERYVLPYRQSLERLGIAVEVRIVDAAQYQNRLRSYDFDLTTASWPQSLSPGNEQREFFGSAAADRPGSRNLIGIKDAAVDALIERIIFATDREGLVAATRALDRVLLAHDYVVPQWSSPVTRTVRWNRFGRPDTLPRYGGSGFPAVWWYDAAAAGKTGAPP